MQEVAKFKEKRTKQLGKECMGLTNVHCWFPKGTLQWRRNLGKSRINYKAKGAKNHHGDKVQGEKDSKFPMIVDKGRTMMFSAKLD